MWEGDSVRKPATTFKFNLIEGILALMLFALLMNAVYEAAFDRETFKCRLTQGCVVPEPADAGALAKTGATSTGAITKRGNVTVINLDQLDCEYSLDFAPDYVENTKYLDGKCYVRTSGIWEELSTETIRSWENMEKKRLEGQALQDKLNSD